MCGIAGLLVAQGLSADDWSRVLIAMGTAMTHRGPDDAGAWVDLAAGVGLAHRRLSIQDLSPAGHQPMISPSGRYAFVMNGEIYNHRSLRQRLEAQGLAPLWRGHSDTETLLACFEAWGVPAAVEQASGMFAFALWDRTGRELILARDRVGEKPLYCGWQGGRFIFASELKALRAYPGFDARVDRGSLALFLRHNCVPAPHSIYEGIRKLEPGCLLYVSLEQRSERTVQYWSARVAVEDAIARPFRGSHVEAIEELDRLLRDVIMDQTISDVPLGAFLSGGIDSSLIVALMQANSSRPVKTFTIGFNEAGYNEAVHARAVAKCLGTDHHELYVSSRDALDVIPRIPVMYDEPFADSSQIPTFLVSKLARDHVTVALSGDGGDELFAGYNRYAFSEGLWPRLQAVPVAIRRVTSKVILSTVGEEYVNAVVGCLPSVLRRRMAYGNVGEKLHKLADVAMCADHKSLYKRLTSHWLNPESVVIGALEPMIAAENCRQHPVTPTATEWMMATDLVSYLPDDVLAKVDRAAMAVSLETRVPFLDRRVIEFAWRLPFDMKMNHGQGKWLLRQLLYRYVPKDLVERPKMGFAVPIGRWLREDLRDWAEALLDESRLRREGYFDSPCIWQRWREHQSGKRNWQYQLWNVLMFQQWLEHTNVR